ncbi:MAG: hypothetical protein WD403_04015 [Pirellulales bacterium]
MAQLEPLAPARPAAPAGADATRSVQASQIELDQVLPSPEAIQREISHVLSKQLSPALTEWGQRYSQVGKRNTYLWKWCRQGVEVTALGCVAPELYDEVCDTKVLGVMLDVLIDDIADQKGDGRLLEQLLRLPLEKDNYRLSKVAPKDRAYAEFTIDVWREIHRRASRFPLYASYATLWRYDYLQLFNAMRYSHLVNEDPALLNLAEHDAYLPHNMHIIVSSTMDLMCSPGFDRRELGKLRDVIWHAQRMGRIGNLVTTWERELGEGDYTSGVYARALVHGDVSLEQLLSGDRETIAAGIRGGRHEEYFLRQWAALGERFDLMQPMIRSVDIRRLREGYQRLICLHLGSRGYK